MKQIIFSITLLLAGLTYGQTNIVKCLSHEAVKYMEQNDPTFKERYVQQFNEAKERGKNTSFAKAEYTIPVVVHIVYAKPEQNLPDSVVFSQIESLNEDYSRTNADRDNLRDTFSTIAGTPNIRFVLATKDPNGNPTNGITRTETTVNPFADLQFMLGDMSSLERIKSTANGGIDPWDQTRYLNLWVANMNIAFGGQEMTALLGYATPPAGLPHWPANSTGGLSDGVVINYNVFGRNNPNPLTEQGYVVKGRTASHEIGHYLGLRHIWGDASNCNEDDGVDDTPNATDQSQSDCDITKNTCTNDSIGALGDLPDMVENFMDYSAETCQNTFTKGQVEIMRGVLDGPRYDLVNDNDAVITKDMGTITSNIYPNPTKGSFTMSFSSSPEYISILDLNGREIMNIQTTSPQVELDLTEMQSGVYLIKYGNQLQNTNKVVKF